MTSKHSFSWHTSCFCRIHHVHYLQQDERERVYPRRTLRKDVRDG